MNDSFNTQQKYNYETLYRDVENSYGMPDRKISDQPLIGKKILSLGCGIGNDLWHLVGGNTVIGVDYAISGLVVSESHGIPGVACDLNFHPTLPFDDKTFDVVICKDILEHILEPLLILRDVYRILKDNGYVIISVPNHFYLPFRARILMGKGLIWNSIGKDHRDQYDEWDYMHIRFFTYRGFRRFLAKASFQPEKWYWDFGTLAHYQNPDLWLEPQIWKKSKQIPLSKKGSIGYYLIRPLWKAFNLIFPRSLRSGIVSLAPGLLCSGFYVRARKA